MIRFWSAHAPGYGAYLIPVPMSVARKFKTALDETRLLMLGSQIFFGFQLNGTFQSGLETVPAHMKVLDAAALLLMSADC